MLALFFIGRCLLIPSGDKMNFSHRITEWSGLEGTSVGHLVQPPAEAGSPGAGKKERAGSFEGRFKKGKDPPERVGRGLSVQQRDGVFILVTRSPRGSVPRTTSLPTEPQGPVARLRFSQLQRSGLFREAGQQNRAVHVRSRRGSRKQSL